MGEITRDYFRDHESLDEARRQLHIVFPADEKSQEKKKQKKTAKEEE